MRDARTIGAAATSQRRRVAVTHSSGATTFVIHTTVSSSGKIPIDYVVLINIAAMPVGDSPVAAFDDVRIMRRGTILSICVQYCLRSSCGKDGSSR